MDSAPTGDDLLDPILADIVNGGDHNVHYWLTHAAVRAWKIQDKALARLVSRDILDQRGDDYHWSSGLAGAPASGAGPGSMPSLTARPGRVKVRILAELFDGDIPDPRDVMIISLADACGLFPKLLTPQQLKRATAA